ncbi:MAG: hypothetical protein IKU08_06555 [Clostridia bacterium]|nr:hypothetical protein [Clostridia bacterium]
MGNRWSNIWCRDDDDELITYTKSKNQLKKALKSTKEPYVSTIYNELLALELIRDAVYVYAQHIAIWLREPETSLSFLIATDDKIGEIYRSADSEPISSRCAMLTLRKSEEPCKNRSGFYVEKIFPIPEIADI